MQYSRRTPVSPSKLLRMSTGGRMILIFSADDDRLIIAAECRGLSDSV